MCLLLCACSESPEQSEKPDEVISIIDRGGIPETVPSQGGTYGVRFSSRENWFVALYYTDSAANWISVSPMSGDSGDGEIFISLKSNTTLADRKCFVRIMAGDSQTTIEIGQARQNSVSLSSQQFWLDAAAGEFQIQVQANVVYQVKIEADWIELGSPENESLLTFRAKVNVGDTRTGTIVVSGGGVSAKAEVTQFAPSEIIRFPDAKFKSYLMRYDITGDGEISRQEALRVETISCGGRIARRNRILSESDLAAFFQQSSAETRFEPQYEIELPGFPVQSAGVAQSRGNASDPVYRRLFVG
mgnify:CR=1 FL=1